MRMDIYEARLDGHARGVDLVACGRLRKIAHRRNTIARNPDIRSERLVSRTVVDGAAAEDEVEIVK